VLSKAGKTYTPSGTLDALRGTYTLKFGQVTRDFTVERGSVRYFGDLNAALDIRAVHVVRAVRGEEIPVIANITGTLYAPKVTLESTFNPPISETDLVSYLVAGYPAFLRISDALGDLADFRSEDAAPLLMVNWRAFVLYATPWIDNDRGALLATLLAAASVVLLLYLWRGPWNAGAPEFSVRFTALALGAIATSWHSHVHGIALAMVPLAAAWAQPGLTFRTRLGIAAAVYLPTLLLFYVVGIDDRFAVRSATDVSLWYVWPDGLPVLSFLAAFVLVCRDLWRLDRPGFSTVLARWPRLLRSYAR